MKRLISFLLSALMILGAFSLPVAASEDIEGAEVTAPAEKVYGDANCDGTLSVTDAIEIVRSIAGWDTETFSSALADYTLEGDLNILDAIMIVKVIAGYDYDPEQTLLDTYGVTEIDFDVPEPTPETVVSSAEFGFDTAADDNRAAFQAAAAYLVEHPGTTLLFETGTYKMSAGVSFTGVKNCVVDGNGSTFLFRSASYFSINGATDSFMMTNFFVEWDYEAAGMIASTVRIRSITPIDDEYDEYEFDFFRLDEEGCPVEDASYVLGLDWFAMTLLNPETLAPSAMTDEVGLQMIMGVDDWIDFSTLKMKEDEPNIITAKVRRSGFFGREGFVWRIRHYCGGMVFSISDATNITVRDVNIYSTPAGGFSINGAGTHHIKLDGVNIGVKPEHAAWECISTSSDCTHVKDMGGYLIIENCNMGYGGEDILNIHANVGRLTEIVSEDTFRMQVTNGNPFSQGCQLVFKDMTTFEDYEYTAIVKEYSYFTNEAGERFVEAKVDSPLPDYIDVNTVVINPELTCENYIIRNNYFHEERGRAQVVGAGYGLLENNHYYGFSNNAVLHIVVDYSSQWYEGTGVKNLIIRNNTFEGNGSDCAGSGIMFDTVSIFESIAGGCFEDILIYNNNFVDNYGYISDVRQAKNVVFWGNVIDDSGVVTDPYDGKALNMVSRGKITCTGKINSLKKVIAIDNTWIPYESAPKEVNIVEAAYAFKQSGKVIEKNNVIEDIPMNNTTTNTPKDDTVLDPSKEYNILFVGNSYTYYNSMPEELFAPIAESVGYKFNVTQLTKGGWHLYDSANAEDDLGSLVDAALKETKYDFVILQDQSTNPGNDRGKFYEGVRRLVKKIEENGATPLLYGTWGRAHESTTLDQNGWTNESMTWMVSAAYEAIGEELGIDVAYAGLAFYDIYNNYAKGADLYADDYTHPSPKGSYLAALTIFAKLTGVDPTTVTFRKGLNQREAMDYREAARKAVFETPEIPAEYKTSSVGVTFGE